MFSDLANSGAMPALERMLRFTAARQKLITHNIANLDTPDFVPLDVSPKSFQAALRKAVEARRSEGRQGDLPAIASPEVQELASGELLLRPGTPSGNVLYHDRNNRDLEKMMQDLAENGLAFRAASDLIRREMDILRVAISQRV